VGVEHLGGIHKDLSAVASIYTRIAKFVREPGAQIQPMVTQVLLTCDHLWLI
jgi:hypothetical protein